MWIMRPHNPHNTFKLLIDFWFQNIKNPILDPHYPLRVTGYAIFLNFLYNARILNSSPTFFSSFLLIRRLYLSLTAPDTSLVLDTEIFSTNHLSWSFLSSIFPLAYSLSSSSRSHRITLLSTSSAPHIHELSPKSSVS